MGFGLYKQISVTYATGAVSFTVNLTRPWRNVYLECATNSSGSAMDVYAANAAAGTYKQIRMPAANTASSQSPSFIIAATAMAGGAMVPIPAGFQYYKVLMTDSALTVSTAYIFHCSD